MVQSNPTEIHTRTEEKQLLNRLAAGDSRAFWSLFEQYRDHLFRCCLNWMNGNITEAEELLSQAMLKAFKKAHKYAEKIENFKFWLTKLIRNFWLDLKRRRGVNRFIDIEGYGDQENLRWVSVQDTPASALEKDEQEQVIRRAIHELPIRVRETFILHFYQELSHQQIAEQQEISYPNVCKRISQARAILRETLREYFIGEENFLRESVVTPAVTELATEERVPQNVEEVDPLIEEPVTSSVEVEVVAIAATIGEEEAMEIVRFHRPSELEAIASTGDDSLPLQKIGDGWVKATGPECPVVSMFALAKVEEKTTSWVESCRSIPWKPELSSWRQLAVKFKPEIKYHLYLSCQINLPIFPTLRQKLQKMCPSCKSTTGSRLGLGFASFQSFRERLWGRKMGGNCPVSLTASKGADFPDHVKPVTRDSFTAIGFKKEERLPEFWPSVSDAARGFHWLKNCLNLPRIWARLII